MQSGNSFKNQTNLKISTSSAFRPWKKPKIINSCDIIMGLIESGEIRIARKKDILTPAEGLIWINSLNVKCFNGIIKILN
jgi:hypothetical protein